MPRTPEEQKAIRAAATKRWREKNKAHYNAQQNQARKDNYNDWYARNGAKKREIEERRQDRLMTNFVDDVQVSVLFERDGGICKLCEKPTTLEEATIDHIVSLANGGEHSYSNTQLAHGLCNSLKGNRDAPSNS